MYEVRCEKCDVRSRMYDGRCRMEDGRCRMEDGGVGVEFCGKSGGRKMGERRSWVRCERVRRGYGKSTEM